MCKYELTAMLYKAFQKLEKERTFPTYTMRPVLPYQKGENNKSIFRKIKHGYPQQIETN